MYTIRLAEEKDRDAIIAIGMEFAGQTVAENSSVSTINMMLDKCAREGVVFVAEKNGNICGTCGGFFADVLLAGGLIFHEVAWYVKPEERGCGMMLLDAMEEAARNGGAKSIIMVSYSNDSQRVVEIAYRRRGYKEIEHHWIRRF